MVLSYVVLRDGKPVVSSASFLPEAPDASWHTATYLALADLLEQRRGNLGGTPRFLTDNELVVKQIQGRRGVKGGHYVEAREDALDQMAHAFPLRGQEWSISWIPRSANLAVPLGVRLFDAHGIEPWFYDRHKMLHVGPTAVLKDGTEVPWSVIKDMGARDAVSFRVAGDRNGIEFRLQPDFLPGSFVLAWTTAPERAGLLYTDCRCRSNNPDDFLSRIASLVSKLL